MPIGEHFQPVTQLDMGEMIRKMDDLCDALKANADFAVMNKAMIQRMLANVRQNVAAESPISGGNEPGNNIIARQLTRSNKIITGILALVASGAGTISLQIGGHVLPPIANPASGVINLYGLSYDINATDALGMTLATAAANCYIAFFGIDIPNTSSMEQV